MGVGFLFCWVFFCLGLGCLVFFFFSVFIQLDKFENNFGYTGLIEVQGKRDLFMICHVTSV